MEITGLVQEVGAVQQVSDTFKKRDLVIQYAENPQFVEYIKFEATQDKVNLFDGLNPGDEVTVSFNLRGRPWTNKEGVTSYFNSLVAWRISKGQSAPKSSSVDISASADNDEDDLPF